MLFALGIILIGAAITYLIVPLTEQWFLGYTKIEPTLTGVRVSRWRFGLPHGTALYYENDELTNICDFKFGKKHGIAVRYLREHSKVEMYHWDTRYGPIKYYKRGLLRAVDTPGQFYQYWYSNGQPHLFYETQYTPEPILLQTEWRRDGSLRKRAFYKDSLIHRTDGAAATYYARDGSVRLALWYIEGRPHRIDGPAVEGSREEYFIYGAKYTRAEFNELIHGDILAAIALCLPGPIAEEIINQY